VSMRLGGHKDRSSSKGGNEQKGKKEKQFPRGYKVFFLYLYVGEMYKFLFAIVSSCLELLHIFPTVLATRNNPLSNRKGRTFLYNISNVLMHTASV